MYHRLVNEDDEPNTFEFKNRSKEHRRNNSGQTSDGEKNLPPELDPNRYDFLEHNVKPDETLPGIALQYECSVSQLKHFNRIISSQDFFVLKTLRIPILKHGFLTEGRKTTRFVDDLVPDSSNKNPSSNVTCPKTQVINIGISKYLNENDDSKDYKKFLENLSEDLQEIRKFNENKLLKNDSDTVLLASDSPVDLAPTNSTSNHIRMAFTYSCDGSDYGIHWKFLILFTIFLCLLVPMYVLYNLEHHHNATHHHY